MSFNAVVAFLHVRLHAVSISSSVPLRIARGIRNLLELLGVRVCAATDKTGDDNGVQRATHRLLYGPRVC